MCRSSLRRGLAVIRRRSAVCHVLVRLKHHIAVLPCHGVGIKRAGEVGADVEVACHGGGKGVALGVRPTAEGVGVLRVVRRLGGGNGRAADGQRAARNGDARAGLHIVDGGHIHRAVACAVGFDSDVVNRGGRCLLERGGIGHIACHGEGAGGIGVVVLRPLVEDVTLFGGDSRHGDVLTRLADVLVLLTTHIDGQRVSGILRLVDGADGHTVVVHIVVLPYSVAVHSRTALIVCEHIDLVAYGIVAQSPRQIQILTRLTVGCPVQHAGPVVPV